ncbi:hypothetical protein EI427_14125 [Flammeovirga pectinis]|uniref:Uncharacterized protein n=1 Tax=Flammeovirga pectinis TaxID=2494373 RepID=A0A3S9P525_9BACT|nr:hypothetical protein [Flammeovirga pectinis]AZQ63336.1 hypothetical protein EI427_14125 [Flammeovirga pectinis]
MKIYYQKPKNILYLFVFIISTISFSLDTFAQGCSDAGVCSIGPMKHTDLFDDVPTNGELRFKPSYGLGEKAVSVINLQIEGDYSIADVVYFQFQLPYTFTTGNLGSANGLGDLTLSLSAPVFTNDKVTTTVFAGTKIPSNDGNLMQDGQALPMVYQTSLGTYDLLAGIAVNVDKLLFSVGYQQPLTQNSNTYIETGNDPDNEYWSTNEFERQPDVAIRAEYGKNAEKINWKAGLLGIIHIGEDSYLDPTDNQRKNIEGSSGLTLNITGGVSKSWGRYSLGSDLGFPIIARSARPDGLTRSFVLSLYGGWKF